MRRTIIKEQYTTIVGGNTLESDIEVNISMCTLMPFRLLTYQTLKLERNGKECDN